MQDPSGTIVIAGGTGFLGLSLARHLDELGCQVVLISRHPPAEALPWTHATWDARTLGAFAQLARLARWGLGGTVGRGRQGISWIHEQDMNRLFARAIADERMRGAYLATAPRPVSNAEFMRELRGALGRPLGLPAPSWLVRLAAPLFLATDPELALYGRYCVSRRLEEEGFEFRFPDLASALRDLCAERQGHADAFS